MNLRVTEYEFEFYISSYNEVTAVYYKLTSPERCLAFRNTEKRSQGKAPDVLFFIGVS